jgi:hypothetical protein
VRGRRAKNLDDWLRVEASPTLAPRECDVRAPASLPNAEGFIFVGANGIRPHEAMRGRSQLNIRWETVQRRIARRMHYIKRLPRPRSAQPHDSEWVPRSYLVPRTSYLAPRTSHLVPRTPYLAPPTSYLLPPTSHLTPSR